MLLILVFFLSLKYSLLLFLSYVFFSFSVHFLFRLLDFLLCINFSLLLLLEFFRVINFLRIHVVFLSLCYICVSFRLPSILNV